MYNHVPSDYQCPMCLLISGKESEFNKLENIVYQDGDTLAFISPKWWVNNPGHVMVVPKKHVENIYDIDEEMLSKVYMTGRKIAIAMKSAYSCEGTSFRQHNEPAGNQDMWHFHVHIFPRWSDDNLYLNHDKNRWVSEEEKSPYAEKLRLALLSK